MAATEPRLAAKENGDRLEFRRLCEIRACPRSCLTPNLILRNAGSAANAEPLIINTAGSLQYRPEAQVEVENLFVASDYVRTYTDIACMQAAYEAARRAVNCLLAATGAASRPARLWPLEESEFLKPLQEIDRIRFALGQQHHAGRRVARLCWLIWDRLFASRKGRGTISPPAQRAILRQYRSQRCVSAEGCAAALTNPVEHGFG